MFLAGGWRASSQGFVNLNFEAANVVGLSPGSTLSAASAFPGWTLSITPPFYDGVSLGGAMISVNDANTGFGGFSPIEGNFSAILTGGAFNTPATISQTAVVPDDTLSVQIMVRTFQRVDAFQVMMGGQVVLLVPVGSGSGYTLYGGDVSAFSGLNSTLSITAFGVSGISPNAVVLDNIQFSNQPIPEPSVLGLICFGFLGLAFFQQRIRKR